MSVALQPAVYFCADVQSGNHYFTYFEPDRYEREYLYVQEVEYKDVPTWGRYQLEAE